MPNHFDIAELKKLSESHRLVRDVSCCLSRQAEADTTTTIEIDSLLEELAGDGVTVNRNLIISLMRSIERTGVGRLIVGRKGKKSRFESVVPLPQLARILSSTDGDFVVAGGPSSPDSNSTNSPTPSGQSEVAVTPHNAAIYVKSDKRGVEMRFQVAPDFVVSVTVPQTLTKKEALKFADFIKSIPFESETEMEA